MKRDNFWRSTFVVFLVAWALFEMSPPNGRDLIDVFEEQAVNIDDNFRDIVAKSRELSKDHPEAAYGHLRAAVGTNNLQKYFSYRIVGESDINRGILNRVQKEAAGQFILGLDLRGGVSFLVQLDTNKVAGVVDSEALQNQAAEVLRKRVDSFGVSEPIIRPEGEDRILIQMPGLTEEVMRSAREAIEKPAFLEFRMVHPRSDELIQQGLMAPGYEILSQKRKSEKGTETTERLLVKLKPEQGLTGKYLNRAGVTRNPLTLQPLITFSFNTEGAKIFANLTSSNIGERMAIVLDGELYSAPVIRGQIRGDGQIEGDFTLKEAYELANVLENPLETPVTLLRTSHVDPSLGNDSIRSGSQAAIIGIVGVGVFMLGYYFVAGVLANVALLLNLVILLGVMCSLDATFTLPGIAGIVLTVGMAVDANVLIYERIREELAHGKSLRGAINAGYDKAWGTIFDSNITTLIASVILIYLGSGPIKGFGYTLTIGICASMFTALIVTRLLFDFMLARGMLKNLNMLQAIKDTKIDFLKWSKPAAIGSVAVLVFGLGYGVIVRGERSLGIDFRGGDSMTYTFSQHTDVEKLRTVMAEVSYTENNQLKKVEGDSMIQYQKNLGDGAEHLLVTVPSGAGPATTAALMSGLPDAGFKEISAEQVGAVIGKEILKSACLSVVLALFGILFYVGVRFEFSFSVAAVVAVLHDFLITIGLFLLMGRELSAPIVAALLTVIGFSINDTIVIFDRIREDLKLGIRGTFKEVINTALNETLSRTIITSGTTLLATMSLAVFGGGVINDFAVALLIGVVVGTYSSIYVACATVLWWHKGQRPKMASAQVDMTGVVVDVPATVVP